MPYQIIELAYLLYCMSEMLRGSDKLDDYDTRFLDVMLTSGRLLRDGSPNAEKLKLLKDALENNEKRKERFLKCWGSSAF